jgi:hypothetical protein
MDEVKNKLSSTGTSSDQFLTSDFVDFRHFVTWFQERRGKTSS